ncbi:MAG: polysaccharide deacetylase family protein [Pseudomonadota bacterium]
MKNTVKRLLVPILASRPVAAVVGRFLGSGVPVFMLHRMNSNDCSLVGGTQANHLRQCLQYLVENDYTFISLEQIVTALGSRQPLPPRAVAFTMDDGYADQAKIAAPIFEEFNCPLTFFVITGMLDQALWPWDAQVAWITGISKKTTLDTAVADKTFILPLCNIEDRRRAKRELHDAIRVVPSDRISEIVNRIARDADVVVPEEPPAAYQPMSWDMARQLERQGIQFAPHSVSHHVFSCLDATSMQQEISDSWRALDRELLNPLKLFCYPTGREIDYGTREIEALRKSGFMGAVTTTPGFAEQLDVNDERLFRIPRFSLPESMHDFIQCCTWIEYVKGSHQSKDE